MANYFIDPSASTNGDGTTTLPFNNLETVTITANNTYYIRRVAAIPANRTINSVAIPNGVKILGWPKVGDIGYITRPTNAAWDADVADYPTITSRLSFINVHSVELTRIHWDLNGIVIPNTPSWKVIYASGCSNLAFKNITTNYNPTPYSNYENNFIHIAQSRQIFIDVLFTYHAFNIYAAGSAIYFTSVSQFVANIRHYTKSQTGVPSSSSGHDSPNSGIYMFYTCLNGHVKIAFDGDQAAAPPWVRTRVVSFVNCIRMNLNLDYRLHPPLLEPNGLYMSASSFMDVYLIGPRIGNVVSQTGANKIVAVTDAIVPRNNTSSYLDPIKLDLGSIMRIHPYTPNQALSLSNVKTYDVLLDGGSELYIEKVAKAPVVKFVSVNNAASLSFKLATNNAQYFLTSGGETFSSALKRPGRPNGYQAVIRSSILDYQPLFIGDSIITPYYSELPAGTTPISLHGAIPEQSTHFPREGDLTLVISWVDTNGKQVVLGSTLTYIAPEAWDGLTTPRCFKLGATITLASPCAVRACLQIRVAGRYEYLILDDHLSLD